MNFFKNKLSLAINASTFIATIFCVTISQSVRAQTRPPALQPAIWSSGTNLTINTDGHGGITKNPTPTDNVWRGTLATKRIVRDGRVLFKAKAGGASNFAVGLNLVNSNEDISDIDYRILLTTSNTATAYAGSTSLGALGTTAFTATTEFLIQRIGSEVQFIRRDLVGGVMTTVDIAKTTAANASGGAMWVDAAFYKSGSEMLSCYIDTGDVDGVNGQGDGMADAWEESQLPPLHDWADVLAFEPGGDADEDEVSNLSEFQNGTLANDPLSRTRPIVWQDLVKAEVITSSLGGLQKSSSPATTEYDADARSTKLMNEDGRVMFSVSPGQVLAVGLTETNDNRAETDLEWAFLFAGTTFVIQRTPDSTNNHQATAPLSTYNAETIFTIQRIGAKIQFLKDGVLVYTSTKHSVNPLFVDCSLNTPSAKITQASMDTGDMDEDGLPDVWERVYLPANSGWNGLLAFQPSGNSDNSVVLNGSGQTSFTNDNNSNQLEWKMGTSPKDHLSRTEGVVWQNVANTSTGGNEGNLTKTSPTATYNARAFGAQVIREDGLVVFQVPSASIVTVGLDAANWEDSTPAATDMDLAFITAVAGTYTIRGPAAYTPVAPLNTYNHDTRFAIVRTGGVVTFLRNGVVVYTSPTKIYGPLYISAWLSTPANAQVSLARVYDGDLDNDLMPDSWELGFLPLNAREEDLIDFKAAGTGSDPDGDLVSNLDEYYEGTHPKRALIKSATVLWQANPAANMTINNVVGGVKKNISAGWNSDAVASELDSGNLVPLPMAQSGSISFSAVPASALAVGLTANNGYRTQNDLEFMLQFATSNAVDVYEGIGNNTAAALKADLGQYYSTSRFTIRRVGTQIEYLKDGVLCHTSESTAPLSVPLYVDSSFNTLNSEISSARYYNGDVDGDGMPDEWEITQYQRKNNGALPSHTDLSNFAFDGDPDGDLAGNLFEYLHGSDPLQQVSTARAVTWTSLTNTLLVPGSEGGLKKNSTTGTFNADARSAEFLAGDGTFSFSSAPNALAVGLTYSDGNDSSAETDLEYAFILTATDAKVQRPEDGTDLSVGTYTANTVFAIRRTGQLIEFLMDEVVVYSSTTASVGALYADCSFTTVNHPISSAYLFDGDVDADGLPDWWELQHLTAGQSSPQNIPLTGVGSLQSFAFDGDADGDGLGNHQEYLYGTSPSFRDANYDNKLDGWDTDLDGMPDGWEIAYGLNPTDPSNKLTDLDSDGLDNLNEYLNQANPRVTDTDGDGMYDGYEVVNALVPVDARDADADKDGDGVPNLWEFVRFKPNTNPQVRYSANDSADTPAPDMVVDYTLSRDWPVGSTTWFRTLSADAYNSLRADPNWPALVFIRPGVYSVEGLFNADPAPAHRKVALVAAPGTSSVPSVTATKSAWNEGVVITNPSWSITTDWLFNGMIFSGSGSGLVVKPHPSSGAAPQVRFINCLFRDIQVSRSERDPNDPADLEHDGGAVTNLGGAVMMEHCTLYRCNSFVNNIVGGANVTRGVASVANLSGTLEMKNSIVWDDEFPVVSSAPFHPPVTGLNVILQNNLIQGGMEQSLAADPMLITKGYPTSQSSACFQAGAPTYHSKDQKGQQRSLTVPGLGAVEWISSETGAGADSLPDWWEMWWFNHTLTKNNDITDEFQWKTIPPLLGEVQLTAVQHYFAFSTPIFSFDGDSLRDDWERRYFANLAQTDSGNGDNDARTNLQEQQDGTDPTKMDDDYDSDNDGLPDNWEIKNFYVKTTAPAAPVSPLRYGKTDDPDLDGWTNIEEYWNGTIPTNPDAVKDSDTDNLPDAWEISNFGGIAAQSGTDDYDEDNLDNLTEYLAGSDPKLVPYLFDGNTNGLWDRWEIQHFGALLTSMNARTDDADMDGRSNEREMLEGTDPDSNPNEPDVRPIANYVKYQNFSFTLPTPKTEDSVSVGFDFFGRAINKEVLTWDENFSEELPSSGDEAISGSILIPEVTAEKYSYSGSSDYGVYDTIMPMGIPYNLYVENYKSMQVRLRTANGLPADRLIVRSYRRSLSRWAELFYILPGQTHSSGPACVLPAPTRYMERISPNKSGGKNNLERAIEQLVEEPLQIPRSIPPSDIAGPRYRKIALNGVPMPDSKPGEQNDGSALPEETYVDSYNRQIRHSTSDVWLSNPSSDLPVQVRRDYASEVWSWCSGLRPDERPDRPFGPGWTSNLTPHIRIELNLNTTEEWIHWFYSVVSDSSQPGGYKLINSQEPYFWERRQAEKLRNPPQISLTDERGASYSFTDLGLEWDFTNSNPVERGFKAKWVSSPNERFDAKTSFDTLQQYPEGLAKNAQAFILKKRNGTKCYYSRCSLFQSFPQDRMRPMGQKVENYYFRLERVETAQGNRLEYVYDNPFDTTDESVPSLIPYTISDSNRPDCKIIISQDKGRIEWIQGPSGEKVYYRYSAIPGQYQLSNLQATKTGIGPVAMDMYPVLSSVARGEGSPAPQEVSYEYSYAYEVDPTPDLTTPTVQTYGHLDLAKITDERGNSHRFRYESIQNQLSQATRYEVWNGAFDFTRKQAGTPLLLKEIERPDHTVANPSIVTFGGLRNVLLRYNKTVTGGIQTTVSGPCGTYTYTFEQPHTARPQEVTNFFNGWQDNYPDGDMNEGVVYLSWKKMTITSAAGTEQYLFKPNAGMALESVTDLSGCTTTYQYTDLVTMPPGSYAPLGFTYYDDPNVETSAIHGQPKNPLNLPSVGGGTYWGKKTYTYQMLTGADGQPLTRVLKEVLDERKIKTVKGYNSIGLCTQEDVYDSRTAPQKLLRRTTFSYAPPSNAPPNTYQFNAFLYRQTVTTDGFTLPVSSGPGWYQAVPGTTPAVSLVTDFLPDKNGRVWQETRYAGPGQTLPMTTTTTYTTSGQKQTVTDPRQNVTTFTYYPQTMRLESTIFPDTTPDDPNDDSRTRKVLVYDAHGNLTREEVWGVNDALKQRTIHQYDVFNRRTKTTIDMGLKPITDAASEAAAADDPYDPEETALPSASNLAGSPVYDGDIVTSTTYNAFNLPVSVTDPRGVVTLNEYDAIGRLIRTTVNSTGPVEKRQVTRYTNENSSITDDFVGGSVFDSKGFKPLRVQDPRGFVTTFEYDYLYRETARTLEDTTYPAEPFSARIVTTRTVYDDAGNPEFKIDALGRTTRTVFDGLNQAREIHPPYVDSLYPRYTLNYYTPAGQLWRSLLVQEKGSINSFIRAETLTFHDHAGRPTHVYGSPVQVIDPATGQTVIERPLTVTQYDDAGNVTHVTDPLGRTTETQYDSRNRPVRVIAPEVANVLSATGAPDMAHPTTVTEYDALDHPISVTDPLNAVTLTKYDQAGRVWRVVSPTVGAQTLVTTHRLDGLGNILELEKANAQVATDLRKQVVTNQYDEFSRLTHTTTRPTDDSGDDITDIFAYDLAGNRTSVKDGLHQISSPHETQFFYDAQNRLIRQVFANGNEQLFIYDALRKQAQSDSGRFTYFSYDVLDRLILVSSPDVYRLQDYDFAGRLDRVQESGHSQAEVNMTYNELGWLITETSSGVLHTYSYDLAGNRVRAAYGTGRTVSTTYDALNRPLTITDDAATPLSTADDRSTTYGYDLAGRAVRLLQPNGNLAWNVHDVGGRLKQRTLYASSTASTVLTQLWWDHDTFGNVLFQEETWPGDTSGLRPAGWRLTSMSYDGVNRLEQEIVSHSQTQGQAGTELVRTTYTYDKANNRDFKTVQGGDEPGVWDYDYNAANQMYRWRKFAEDNGLAVGDVVKDSDMIYDVYGNRTSQSVNDYGGGPEAVTTYQWDAQNRLKQVTMPGGAVHAYRYDHRVRRIRTSITTGGTTKTTAIAFAGGLSVAEWEITGSGSPNTTTAPTVEYNRGPDMGGGVGGLLYSLRSGTPKYNLSNGRGDIVAQTDVNGALTWTASYEAYGKRTKETGTNLDKQRANSKDEDPTGLLNEGFRYRDIETGVWLSRDPAGFVDGPNLYAYVKQNPWTMWDPHGLSGFSDLAESAANDIANGSPVKGYSKAVVASLWNAFSFGNAEKMGEVEDATRDGDMSVGQAGVEATKGTLLAMKDAALTYGTGGAVLKLATKYDKAETMVGVVTNVAEGNYAGALLTVAGESVPGGKKTASPGGQSAREVSDAAADSIRPGQTMSAYPQGRSVGGRGESPRLSDPPAGMRESGAWDSTPENLALMERGRPPIGRDGLPVELHHRDQSPAGPLDQMTSTTHDTIPHPLSPSQIDRSKFAGERARYWRGEARTLNGQ